MPGSRDERVSSRSDARGLMEERHGVARGNCSSQHYVEKERGRVRMRDVYCNRDAGLRYRIQDAGPASRYCSDTRKKMNKSNIKKRENDTLIHPRVFHPNAFESPVFFLRKSGAS